MNDQPNGRSKHDPRQSSHNRDHLGKKKKTLDWGVETVVATTIAGRDWPPRAGTGSHHARSCPSVSSGFPPSSPSDRPCEVGNRDPPCPPCAEYGKRGLL